MMGSSSPVRDQEILESILALIRKPEMVAKNIEELHANIAENQEVIRIAKEEQAKAQAASKSIEPRENILKNKENSLKDFEESLNKRKFILDAYEGDLGQQSLNLSEKIKAHTVNLKNLDTRDNQIKLREAELGRKSGDLDKAHEKRVKQLDARETALDEREQRVAENENKIKDKIERLRQVVD